MAIKYTKWLKSIPNGHKYAKKFPVRGPPKFTQIVIFGLKIYHLATQIATQVPSVCTTEEVIKII
jgi:hypothetical protein